MNELRLRTIFIAALLGGLVAALVVAGFHYVATEPIIEQAVAIEAQLNSMDGSPEVEVVSRDVQRTAGLVTGFVLYGLSWAMLYAVAFAIAQRRLPGSGAVQRGLLLAGLAYVAVVLLPFLKYPANPPGVGEHDSITLRENAYIAMLALSIASTAVATIAGRLASRGRPAWVGVLTGAAVLIGCGALSWSVLPANPDPIRIPGYLVDGFRARSLAGLTLFWLVLAASFPLIASALERPVRRPAGPLAEPQPR